MENPQFFSDLAPPVAERPATLGIHEQRAVGMIERLLDEQRFGRGAAYGLAAGLLLTFMGARLVAAYDLSYGWSLIPVALITGLMIRWQGKGIEPRFGVASIGITVLCALVGRVIYLTSKATGAAGTVDEALAQIASTLSGADWLLGLCALLVAFVSAFRRLNVDDLS